MQAKFISPAGLICLTLLTCFKVMGQNVTTKSVPRDWHVLDPQKDSIAGISLNAAYELLKGKTPQDIIVAVIDNGVDIDHEDLKNRIWTNQDEIEGNGLDDDKNGYVDDIHGWNFRGTKEGNVVENEQASSTQLFLTLRSKFETADTNRLRGADKRSFDIYKRARKEYRDKQASKDSADVLYAYNANYSSDALIYGSPKAKLSGNLCHGTHVAGIIAAQRNNGIGMDGIADHVRIMPLLATTAVGDERDKDIARAIYYAVDNGARIVNMSFAKPFSADKPRVDAAIRYAEKKNVLVVHAAGNWGVNIDSSANYRYPIPTFESGARASNFISVGWSRALFDYRLAHPRSDYGKINVDLFAPGSDIFSTVPGDGYGSKSGSSMSAPIVSGVAALLFSYFPSLTAKDVRQILMTSSFKSDQLVNKPLTQTKVPFNTLSVSGGIVNAFAAVRLAIDNAGTDKSRKR